MNEFWGKSLGLLLHVEQYFWTITGGTVPKHLTDRPSSLRKMYVYTVLQLLQQLLLQLCSSCLQLCSSPAAVQRQEQQKWGGGSVTEGAVPRRLKRCWARNYELHTMTDCTMSNSCDSRKYAYVRLFGLCPCACPVATARQWRTLFENVPLLISAELQFFFVVSPRNRCRIVNC